MTLPITPRHADIWAGSSVIAFVSAHIALIDQYLQAGAFIATILTAGISIVARLRKNKREGKGE